MSDTINTTQNLIGQIATNEELILASHVGKKTSEGGEIFGDYENNVATGKYSHAEGDNSIARGPAQHVQGKYNIEDTEEKYAHIVGNGKAEQKDNEGNLLQEEVRSNAHTIDWDGNAWFAGDVKIGTENKTLATEEFVTSQDYAKTADISSTYLTQEDAEDTYAKIGSIPTLPDKVITEDDLDKIYENFISRLEVYDGEVEV